jgi:glucan-binding YG repeat protein
MKMKSLKIYLLAAALLMAFTSCGSVKKVVDSDVHVNVASTTKADSSSVVSSETQHYGDTLSTTDFVPAPSLVDTSKKADTASYSDTDSSNGIQFKETFTPQYKNGVLDGTKVSVVAIAKPTSTTDTQAVKASQVSTTTVKDSTATVKSATTKTLGLGLPSWVWWLIGLTVLAGAIWFIVLPLIKKFI